MLQDLIRRVASNNPACIILLTFTSTGAVGSPFTQGAKVIYVWSFYVHYGKPIYISCLCFDLLSHYTNNNNKSNTLAYLLRILVVYTFKLILNSYRIKETLGYL